MCTTCCLVVNQDLQPTGELPLKAKLLQTGLKENTEPRQASVKDKNSEGSADKEEKAGRRPSGKPGLLAQWLLTPQLGRSQGKSVGCCWYVKWGPSPVWCEHIRNGLNTSISSIVSIQDIFNNSKAIERRVQIEASFKNFPFQWGREDKMAAIPVPPSRGEATAPMRGMGVTDSLLSSLERLQTLVCHQI